MGRREESLRQQYAALCSQLGDEVTKRRQACARIVTIEREIDRLQASLPAAAAADQKEAATPPAETPA